jgi:hypothetical protein
VAESIPKHRPGAGITGHAGAAITGARLLAVTGPPVGGRPQVAHAGAGVRTIGVATNDTAAGAPVGIHSAQGQIVPVEAGVAIAAGQEVESNATGQAVPLAAGISAGLCVEGGAAAAQVLVKLGR